VIFDVNESIQKHINQIRPWSPKLAVVSLGEYSSQVLLKGSFLSKIKDNLVVFVDKSKDSEFKWENSPIEKYNMLMIDSKVDAHFWYDLSGYLKKNDSLITRIENKAIDSLEGAIIVTSVADGVGSALLPVLSTEFKKRKTACVAFALFPSKAQPADAQFNAFSSLGLCLSKEFAPVLLGRDQVENYVGVDRKGFLLSGNNIVNYLLDLVLRKDNFPQEIDELSRSFNVKMYTILAATGASLKVYGTLEKMMSASLFIPLLTFDLSSSKVLYVLVRMPLRLKDKLTRGKIELQIINWFKERANLKTVFVSEPIFTEDSSDRMDIVMFAGDFDSTAMLAAMEKQVSENKNYAIEKGLMKNKEWQAIISSLKGD
jgi:hypothetical protein